MKILERFTISEAENFSDQFMTGINMQMKRAPMDKTALLSYFEMPAGVNPEVKQQVFVTTIIDDKIFGLSSNQFTYQKFENVRDFLISVINTLKKVENKSDFSNLCVK